MSTAALTSNASLVSVAELVGRPVVNASGDQIGRLTDVVLRWDEDTYPAVVGLVLKIGGRRTFLHADDVARIARPSLSKSRRQVTEYPVQPDIS